jgi:hypothetical protein
LIEVGLEAYKIQNYKKPPDQLCLIPGFGMRTSIQMILFLLPKEFPIIDKPWIIEQNILDISVSEFSLFHPNVP